MYLGNDSVRPVARGTTRVARLLLLIVPALLMLVGSLRTDGRAQSMLWMGCTVQALVFCFFVVSGRLQQPIGPLVAVIYLLGLAWTWLANDGAGDWYFHFAQFVLLVVPLLLIGLQTLIDSGAMTTRRARVLAQRLSRRKDWPVELSDVRSMPEVKALREAVALDPSPALALLQHPRPQVRLAALSALEFRTSWRPGQAELVLRFAQGCKEPLLRAAAVGALACLDDRVLVETVAEFLRDPAREVRKAATEALLWDTENRWSWMRHPVRMALADPVLQGDGPLVPESTLFKPEAVNDLLAWATEKGSLGVRAAQTLGVYYRRALGEASGSGLIRNLKHELGNTQAPGLLRIELAQILRSYGELDRDLLLKTVDGTNPAPLRLIAADALLELDRPGMGFNQQALSALRDIARLPNREMALTAADVVQRRLGVDLGLALGQPLPPLHSRQAADVTRRLMRWATQAGAMMHEHEGEHEEQDVGETDGTEPDTPGRGRKKHDHGSGVFNIGAGR